MPKNLLTQLARAFDKERIPYMLIGGQAVLLYGEPRLTRDVDVTVGPTPEDLERVPSVVRELDLRPLVPEVEDFVQQTWVLLPWSRRRACGWTSSSPGLPMSKKL